MWALVIPNCVIGLDHKDIRSKETSFDGLDINLGDKVAAQGISQPSHIGLVVIKTL